MSQGSKSVSVWTHCMSSNQISWVNVPGEMCFLELYWLMWEVKMQINWKSIYGIDKELLGSMPLAGKLKSFGK